VAAALLVQLECIGQGQERLTLWTVIHPTFEVGDAARAEPSAVGEVGLGQPGSVTQCAQHTSKSLIR
jgi:hypothetical protein